MPEALLRLRYAEQDAAGATTALRAVLGSCTVSPAPGAFEWRQESLVDDGITVSRIAVHGGVAITLPRSPELLVVAVREGRVALIDRERRVELRPGDFGLVPLGRSMRIEAADPRMELFGVPVTPLARLIGVRDSEVQLQAADLRPRSTVLSDYLGQIARLLTTETFEREEVYQRDLIRAHVITAFAATVVEAFDLVNRTESRADRDLAVARRAIAFMRRHLREPISVPEIADAAGISLRGLQTVFRRQLDTTPLLHLRQMRLEAAREELGRRAEEGTTVAAIASGWGYTNAGRFSTHYRDAFAESPAAALTRIRDSGGREPGADAADEEGTADP